jgi:hypothetical protein
MKKYNKEKENILLLGISHYHPTLMRQAFTSIKMLEIEQKKIEEN